MLIIRVHDSEIDGEANRLTRFKNILLNILVLKKEKNVALYE